MPPAVIRQVSAPASLPSVLASTIRSEEKTVSKIQSRRGLPQLPSLKPLTYAVFCVLHGLIPMQAMALDNNALPTNGQITSGSGSIVGSGNVLNVNQNSNQL